MFFGPIMSAFDLPKNFDPPTRSLYWDLSGGEKISQIGVGGDQLLTLQRFDHIGTTLLNKNCRKSRNNIFFQKPIKNKEYT